jgi:two-component system response regulator BaeR
MTDQLILIVEDEEKIAAVLQEYLSAAHFRTHRIAHGNAVLPWLHSHKADLILLDLMLLGADGMAVCREIRKTSDVPVIMITARREERDRLAGFDLGVDDYICKPFSPKEVVARVSALLRRSKGETRSAPTARLLLNRSTYRVTLGDNAVSLTALEFGILDALMGSPGRIFTRDEIMDRIYRDFRIVNDRTIDSHIKKLRRKLGTLGFDETPLRSVYGVGYKFDA